MFRAALLAALACLAAGPAPAQAVAEGLGPFVAEVREDAIPLADTGSPETESWTGSDALSLTVRNVTAPTVTPVLPDPEEATGTGVVVLPGGAFSVLSMGSEGMEVAEALAERGIAAFVVKYRLEETPDDPEARRRQVRDGLRAFIAAGAEGTVPGEARATEDAAAAYRLVRDRAREFGVEPGRLGLLGFSAGAILALDVVLEADPAVTPAFAGLLYGRQAAVPLPQSPPALFIGLAADDEIFGTARLGLLETWRSAGLPVEFHLYGSGGHGFGIRQQGTPSDGWFEDFLAWLAVRDFG